MLRLSADSRQLPTELTWTSVRLPLRAETKGLPARRKRAGRSASLLIPIRGVTRTSPGHKAVILNLQIRLRRGEIGAVVTLPRDPEGLAQPPRPGGQGSRPGWQPLPVRRHGFQSADRLKRAEQDAAGTALRFAGYVQAKIHAVDKVDVGMARRPKEHCVSCRLAGERRATRGRPRRSRLLLRQCGPPSFLPRSYQQLSQQLLGYQVWRIQIKVPGNESCPRARF